MKKKKKLYSGENTAIIVSSEDGTEGASRLAQDRRTTIRAGRLIAGGPGAFFSSSRSRTALTWAVPAAAPSAAGAQLRDPLEPTLAEKNKQNSTAAETALRAESILNRRSGGIQPVARPQLAASGGRRCHAGSYVSAPAVRLRACCRRASD